MIVCLQAIDSFWRFHPALLYGLAFLLGCFWSFNPHPALIVPTIFLLSPLLLILFMVDALALKPLFLRLLLALGLLATAFCYAAFSYEFPSLPDEGIEGVAQLHISSLSESQHPFGHQWVYRGTLLAFYPEEAAHCLARQIPAKLILPCEKTAIPPSASQDYWVKGRLKSFKERQYTFKVSPQAAWYPIMNTWSLAEWRYHAKKTVAEGINSRFKDAQIAAFLSGMATGEFDHPELAHELGRFGLQHIMAISGFHFAIVAGALHTILRLLFAPRRAIVCLLCLLAGYFIFLGFGPSIWRAWMMISLGLASFLFERPGTGLNLLGMALLVVLCFDPYLSLHIGFQFSFLVTGSILLLFSTCDLIFQGVFPKRKLSQMIEMGRLNQHAYCLLSAFRQGLSLALAVNLVALPLMLYHFHQFPWMSLLYNLFFPFMVSVSMFLLLLGFAVELGWGLTLGFFMPDQGNFIHGINQIYTQFLLNYTHQMPSSLDWKWHMDIFPLGFLIVYMTILLGLGIAAHHHQRTQREKIQDFAYL